MAMSIPADSGQNHGIILALFPLDFTSKASAEPVDSTFEVYWQSDPFTDLISTQTPPFFACIISTASQGALLLLW